MFLSFIANICLAIFVLLCIFWLYTTNKNSSLNGMPGPPGYPIIGNVLDFFLSREDIWKRFREMAKEYYPIYLFYHLSLPVVNIISPEDMKIIMSSSTHISKSQIYDALVPWLGTGLLTSTGTKWHYRRKLLTPTFHFNILKQFIPMFNDHTRLLVNRLENECYKPSTNIVPFIAETTLQAISETALGTRLETDNHFSKDYMKSVYKISENILDILIYPWYQTILTAVFTRTFWEHKKLVKILHNFSTNVIKRRKESFEITKAANKRMALLDLLIKGQKLEQNIDDEGIREEVDTFTFEGHDTTTACISFTLLLLANHPDIQNKVLDEITEIFQDSCRMPTFQDLQSMNYLDQVLKESLRIYPSVPFISRVAEEDFQTSSNYTIPRGTILQLHIYDLHHNEDLFPEPEKFDPERFSVENSRDRHPYAYIPFSAGPRNCIGQKFALLEIKIMISTILRYYELLPVDIPSNIDIIVNLTLKAKNGIRIKFIKRK